MQIAHVRRMIARLFSLILAAMALLPLSARAGSMDPNFEARIIPGWRLADGTHVAALQITMKEGWKTYWRAPGDVGLPPRFDWRKSSNLSGVEINWPAPRALMQGGVLTIGYEGGVILPLTVRPERADEDIMLSGVLDFGICKDVCIPIRVDVNGELRREVTKPDTKIAAALAARPFSAQEAGVARVTCRISPASEGQSLRADVMMPSAGGREMAIIETDDPQIWVAPSNTRREGGLLIVETEVVHVEGRAFSLNRAGLRITVLGKSHAVDIQGCPAG